MRIALFNHPVSDFYTTTHRLQKEIPKYLAEICSDHKTIAFDVVKSKRNDTDLPLFLSDIVPCLIDDITGYSFFKKYYCFGDYSNFNHKVLRIFNPQAIVITSFAWCYFEGFRNQVLYIKKLYPEIPILCGGGGPSSAPAYYLENTPVDYVVTGPAETTLPRLLAQIEKEEVTAGIYPTRQPVKKQYTFKPFISHNSKKNRVLLQVTRGCPHHCSYCSVSLTAPGFMISTIEDITEALIRLNLDESPHLIFEDDSLTCVAEWFIQLLEAIRGIYPEFTFSMENGVDFTTLTPELIDKLVSLGIAQWNLSLTSTSQSVLQQSGRIYTRNDFDRVLDIISNTGKSVIVYFISGLPDDTVENILKTLFYLAGKPILPGISPFYPVPKTIAVASIKRPLTPVECKATSFRQWSSISTSEQITLFILTRFINAIKALKPEDFSTFHKTVPRKTDNPDSTSVNQRTEATIAGILASFNKQKIMAVKQNKSGGFHFKPYPLDSKIISHFFEYMLTRGIIVSSSGQQYDADFWKTICQKSR